MRERRVQRTSARREIVKPLPRKEQAGSSSTMFLGRIRLHFTSNTEAATEPVWESKQYIGDPLMRHPTLRDGSIPCGNSEQF